MLSSRYFSRLFVNVSPGTSLRCLHTYKFHKEQDFTFKKVLILAKTTRFEYESKIQPYLSQDDLRTFLHTKGSDYDGLYKRHLLHHEHLNSLLLNLKKRHLEIKVVDRFTYNRDVINWADLIISAGGDGTFLLAASRIISTIKPIFGFNTDPTRSEGYLCLPKKYSENISAALDILASGKFKWLWRQRIRVTMSGKHQEDDEGVDLNQISYHYPEYRFVEHVKENEEHIGMANLLQSLPARVLPVRALNEVFIGESLSARVSYYEMSVDGTPPLKQKSSGVTVCTGTGSSSWSLHINQLSPINVKHILNIAQGLYPPKENTLLPPIYSDEQFEEIAQSYNSSLWFPAEEMRMAYTIRDPVKNGVFHIDYPRGFAQTVTVRSRMYDAHLVIDGGSAFTFNDGAVASFDILPDDALCCIDIA